MFAAPRPIRTNPARASGVYFEASNKTIELDPEFAIGYNITSLNYIERDRLSEAENTLRQAKDRKLDMPDFFGRQIRNSVSQE